MMQTKTALIITSFIAVVVAATMITGVKAVYAQTSCASCGRLAALPGELNAIKAFSESAVSQAIQQAIQQQGSTAAVK